MACVKLNETEDQLIKTREELRNTQEKFEKKINYLENKLLHYQEEHTWKISGISGKLRQANTGKEQSKIDSAPFYTGGFGKYGCKFKIRLTLRYARFSEYISVYFVIMKGEYDSILPWPFRRKVIFTLVDQQEDLNDRENIVRSIALDPTKDEDWNKRPVTDENTAKGFGFLLPFPHLVRQRRFVVDGSIFIQVRVVPSEA